MLEGSRVNHLLVLRSGFVYVEPSVGENDDEQRRRELLQKMIQGRRKPAVSFPKHLVVRLRRETGDKRFNKCGILKRNVRFHKFGGSEVEIFEQREKLEAKVSQLRHNVLGGNLIRR